jgi:predicted transcriptional regulator
MEKEKNINMKFTLPPETIARMEQLARKYAITKSSIVSIAIKNFYEEEAKRAAK